MMTPSLKLYHYWRSTSSWRVRWGLEIKGLKPEMIAINLLNDDSDSPEHLARNPMGYVPVLEVHTGERTHYLSESLAILEWLEETFPNDALYSEDAFMRAHARMLCEIINSGTQPLGNLTVTEHLSKLVPDSSKIWSQHWIRKGLRAFERQAQKHSGSLSIGDELSMPDLFLIPQCYSALRNEVSLDEFPLVAKIYKAACELSSAKASHPDRYQPQT
jgi:maleylpyruvate isomerase